MAEPSIRARNARDPEIWTSQGDLRDAVVRQCAALLQTGASYATIGKVVGISPRVARRKLQSIADAIGLPPEKSAYERDVEEVERRVGAGQSSKEIAQALNRSADSVNAIRRKLGIGFGPRLALTDDEKTEIDQRLKAGLSTRAIAASVGCAQSIVATRRKCFHQDIPESLPPCACGKRKNHGGRCNLIVDPQVIRERLLAGRTTADIAREFNRTAQSFKPKYVQPVIDQLTAEGHHCGCGQPFGHQFVCVVTMAAHRRTFTDAERARATKLFREGLSVAKVKADLGITTSSANILARGLRSGLAAEGVCCPCGAPIDHAFTCSARNGSARGRAAFRFTCAAAANMPLDSRRKVSKLAREGWQISVIARRSGESNWRVTQMVEELNRAGQLPSKCAGCDLSRGHKARCPLPPLCKCGRPRNHRGMCRRADGRMRVPFTKLPPAKVAEVKRRYRDREGIRSISRSTGVTLSTVQRLVSHWRAKSKYGLAPCLCGRPLRHGGICWATKSGVVGKRQLTRIEQGILAGRTSHAMAEQLNLSVMTVLKHSVPIRDRLFAEGFTCACGRALNHNFWCSARWEAYDMPRGRRPFPEPQETEAVEALLRGDLVADIAKAIRFSPDSVWRLRRSLSEEQRCERARAMRGRLACGRGIKGEALMAKIKAAVSSRIDPALRDDVISEIYLAVIEGRVEPEQIGAVVRSFVSRGMAQWQPLHGPRSLDQKAFEDGGATIGDLVGDSTAIEQLDDLTIGGLEQ